MRIVITGGGTGGHIYPAISIAQALREARQDVELLFIGSSHGPEGGLAREAGIPFQSVPSSPLTRSVSFRSVGALIKLVAGVFRARRMLRRFGCDVVVGTGGYTTAAVLVAQRSLGGRIVIHEQNAVPGRTNRWLARGSDKVCVSVPSSAAFFPRDKVVVTGMPVRKEFAELPGKRDAWPALGLRADAFTILVVGGSQGARMLNKLVVGMWPLVDDGSTQVLHQVGERNIEEVRAKQIPNDSMYHIAPYLDMPVAMAGADLVIGRSGASTIAEITAAGLPSIMIPYPYAYADHQRLNAAYLAEHNAAIVCDEDTTTCRTLATVVTELRSSPDKLSDMASASASLGKVDAARQVAEVALSLAEDSLSPGGRGLG